MTDDKKTHNTADDSESIEVIIDHKDDGPIPIDPDPVMKGEDFSGDTETEDRPTVDETDPTGKRIAELEDKLLRAAADFDNYKKRMTRQFEEIARTSSDKLLADFLEIIDNFERAREHAGNEVSLESLLKGNELIHGQMVALLARNQIEPIEALGRPFDPNLHEALFQMESGEYADGIVAQEISKGYRQGSRVLRHSRVGVSKGKGDATS